MATEEHPTLEPVIWFEGTLIRDPLPLRVQDDWLLETLADPDGNGRKITIRARGAEHSENISRNARKGTRLMVKGTAGDEGSGIDIEATSLAFDPSHDEPEKQRHGPPSAPPSRTRPIPANGSTSTAMSAGSCPRSWPEDGRSASTPRRPA